MPRKTSFSILPGTVAATAEEIKGYKTTIDQLADSMTKMEQDIRKTQLGSGVSDIYANRVKSIQENMYYSGKRMGQLADVAAWCAIRYQNAERKIMGQDPINQGSRPEGVPKPGAPDMQPINPKTPDAADKKKNGWQYDFENDVDKWKNWNNKDVKTHYSGADVEFDEDGKVKSIGAYYGMTQDSFTLDFVNTTKRNAQGKLGAFTSEFNDALNEVYGYNKFGSNKWADDYSHRVYDKNGRVEKNKEKENSFSKDIVGVELVRFQKQVKATAWGADGRAEGKYGEAGGSVEVCTAEAHIGGGVGVYYVEKDGKKVLAMGADLSAGVSATVFHASADAQFYVKASGNAAKWLGEDFQFIGAKGSADVKVGHVEASGGLKCRWIDGKPEVVGEVAAGAYALKASAQGSVTCMGITASAKAEVNIGIGASAKIGFTGGKLRCELGASLGIGFKISFDLDIGGAVNAVKNIVSNVADAVSGSITKAAKAVGGAVKKIFSGW